MIEMGVSEVVEEVNKVMQKVTDNSFLLIQDIKEIPKATGIYVIKEKGKDVFYVGSASKQTLFQRLGKNHIKGSSANSVLRRKLELKMEQQKISDYLLNNCEYILCPIESFDEVLAVEHMLIFLLRKKFDLLNDAIDKFK